MLISFGCGETRLVGHNIGVDANGEKKEHAGARMWVKEYGDNRYRVVEASDTVHIFSQAHRYRKVLQHYDSG